MHITWRKQALKAAYTFHHNYFNFNNRKLLIIDDVVTTGSTVCAMIEPIIEEYHNAAITVFALAWTPTKKQQEHIRQLERKAQLFNEPQSLYGKSYPDWIDEDFENGETRITI